MGFKDKFSTKPMKVEVTYKLYGIGYKETYDRMPEAKGAMKDLESKEKKGSITNVKYRVCT